MIPAPTGRDRRGREEWEKEKDEDKNPQIVREQGGKWSSAMLLFRNVRCNTV